MTVVDDVVELGELRLLLTIRQAAKVLDVCPAKAYAMADRYEATGCEGLPVIRLDKLYRVPTGRSPCWSSPAASSRWPSSTPTSTRCASNSTVSRPRSQPRPWWNRRRRRIRARRAGRTCGRVRRSPGCRGLVRRAAQAPAGGLRSSCPPRRSSVRSGSADRCPCGRSGGGSDAAGVDDPCVVGWGVGEVLHPLL